MLSDSLRPLNLSPPFDGEDDSYDVILRTSDSVYFRVHKNILALSSPVFKDMFSIPQPRGSDQAEIMDNRPVIDLPENSRTLDAALRLFYPGCPFPELSNMDPPNEVGLINALEAIRKYGMDTVEENIKDIVKGRFKLNALARYCISHAMSWRDMNIEAAKDLTYEPQATWPNTEALGCISGKNYRYLLLNVHGIASTRLRPDF